MTKRTEIYSWAAFGMAALAFDVAVLVVVTPFAFSTTRQQGTARSALEASKVAVQATAKAVAVAARERVATLAGDGLVAAAKGAARAYTAFMSVTPARHTRVVRMRSASDAVRRGECGGGDATPSITPTRAGAAITLPWTL